jgi:hypothetical protein
VSNDYKRATATALRMLTKHGRNVEIRRTPGGGGAVMTATAKAVQIGIVKRQFDNSGIQIGDLHLIATPTDFEPIFRDRFIDHNGKAYIVGFAEAIKPGAVIVAQYIWVRPG